jgi:hypothetical protein
MMFALHELGEYLCAILTAKRFDVFALFLKPQACAAEFTAAA